MTVPLRTKRNHLTSIVQALDASEPQDKTDLHGVLRDVAETYPRRGMMVLISDLLGRPATACSRACGCCGSAGTTCWCST